MSDDAGLLAEAVAPDRRGYRRALLLLAVGAALLFVGYAQVWASAVVLQEGLPSLAVELKGREIQPAGSASAILALAGIAGLVATRRFGRAVTGVLLVLEGLVALVGALWFGTGAGNRADVVRLVSEKAGIDVDVELSVRPWWVVVAVGGALLVVVGVLAALRGGTWPVMGRKYERADGDGSSAAAGAPTGPASAWEQLDQGVDPTVDPTADPAPDTQPEPTRGRSPGPATGTMTPTDAPEDTP
ncbi:Trp biosynthesis-associated membrane protein [Longivirga aurantiaca]|uniref:Trp biosynthesis-associated membrane protein n=1 Tax=Longivirga aurantiaca TaxID=1837743 RepID=A0ABW1T3R9_9ACTN